MKTSLLLVLSLAATSPLFASRLPAPTTPPPGLPVPHVAPTIQVGTMRVEVAARLGSPDLVLRDGTWLYHRYKASDTAERTVAAGTLVVCFDRSRVTAMSLANDTEVLALRSSDKTPPPADVAKQ